MVRDKGLTLKEADRLAAGLSASFRETSSLPTYVRARILENAGRGIEKRAEEFAQSICREVKKPIKDARGEVARAVFTFRGGSEEAKRLEGAVIPLDLDPGTEGRLAFTRRMPRGPALFITPFNFPLNLVAHKVAPAIAVGAPFFLKPAPQAPGTARLLEGVLLEAGWPKEAMAVAPAPVGTAEALVKDDRFAVLSFTGSAEVGWKLKSLAGKKHVLLELGGNAGVVVGADADLAWAAARCAWGAYCYSGQVCISVQRIFVETAVYPEFRKLLLENIAKLKVGDPMDEATQVGPMISEDAASRVESWIKEAVAGGGKVLAGGSRQGALITPTLIEGAPASCRLSREEGFGPVALLDRVVSRDEALEKLSAGRYGLQAGIFTRDLSWVMRSWREVPVGGLIVNDVPTFRSDAMPYGGIRDSGTGREGVRYAIEEFSELRTLVIKP